MECLHMACNILIPCPMSNRVAHAWDQDNCGCHMPNQSMCKVIFIICQIISHTCRAQMLHGIGKNKQIADPSSEFAD